MKRKHTTLLFLLFAMFVNAQQTYKVSTAEEKQNVLLEEFTGVNCGVCPVGHEIAGELLNGLRDQLCVVNLHAGPFSTHQKGRDLTTDDGESIYEYYKPQNYPCGLINRQDINGDGYIYDRDGWFFLVNKVKNNMARVNLHLESTYNGADSTLTVHVEGYNVADNSSADMKLFVLTTQDNLNAAQMGTPNPSAYIHNHVLTDYITPFDGQAVSTREKGGYFTADFTYTVPGMFHDKELIPGYMNVVAYVTADGMNDVMNVAQGKPEYQNYKVDANAEFYAPLLKADNDYGFNFFEGIINNLSTEHVTTATFEVTTNGETYTSEAACDIKPFVSGDVNVPCHYTYDDSDSVEYEVTLKAINGIAVTPMSFGGKFAKPVTTGASLKVEILTDRSVGENTYCVKDEDGNIITTFGPYAPRKSATYVENITLEADKTYCVEATDIFGNGIYSGKTGTMKITDADGKTVAEAANINGFGTRLFFKVDGSLGITDVTMGEGSDAPTYNINGMMVKPGTTADRIIIRNGKKYINKR